jgi:ribonuclease E
MTKTMLIGASHPEETRVALTNDGRVEDFDFETTGSEQLRGNIYLAKVTRVEPSLQACFVEYGGNRHGFLAFSEIHPDYYQLPQEDREALLEEAAREAAENADDDVDEDHDDDEHDNDGDDTETSSSSELDVIDADDDDEDSDGDNNEASDDHSDDAPKADAKPARRKRTPRKTRSSSASRRYKIQEVIRRRQVLLVQVVKEERGNKGAALTTFLSLAGRYSVLMPNTPRGGGISRKIPNGNDRKRLKTIMGGLEVPKGMGLIVRTAGAKRTKSEITRDYDYLQNLWSRIRSKTLESAAPARIHEEGGLVHRAMRDMFDREIEEVVIQGDDAYREAKDLAKTLMPTQARKVKRWTSQAPLFVSEGIEDQLDSIFNPVVQMKSGGYLVINQTEALVAIDVNSGKSTKERSIEQTALRTNLEAAEEACRQMRLRDLAGLVVIDFIDMDENKNNRSVEKKMKECMKLDRARVQNSRISQFGLMEISRQRRRAGVMQATSEKCHACDGTGHRRSIPSSALQLLRAIEARAAGGGLSGITVTAPTEVALYLLNAKRDAITTIEDEAGFTIAIKSDADLIPGSFEVKVEKESNGRRRGKKFNRSDFLVGDEDDHLLPTDEDEDDDIDTSTDDDDDNDDNEGDNKNTDNRPKSDDSEDGSGRKRRRRGRRGGRRRKREDENMDPGAAPSDGGALLDGLVMSPTAMLGSVEIELPDAATGGLDAAPVALPSAAKSSDNQSNNTQSENDGTDSDSDETGGRKKRRRRRRKRNGSDDGAVGGNTSSDTNEPSTSETDAPKSESASSDTPTDETSEKPKRRRRSRSRKPATQDASAESTSDEAKSDVTETPVVEIKSDPTPPEMTQPEPTQKVASEPKAKPKSAPKTTAVVTPDAPIATEPKLDTETPPAKKKRGWWSRG